MSGKMKQYVFLGCLTLICLLIPQFVKDALFLQYMINILIMAYFTSMWNIIGGYAGQMALGNGVYIGIGAYVSAVLFTYENVNPWIGMFIGGAVCALFALLIGSLTFRLSGSYFALGTVAMLHIIRLIFTSNKVILGYKTKGALSFALPWRGGGLINMQFDSNVGYFYLLFGLLIVGLIISWYIKTSKMGYYLQALSTNPAAANSLGVNVMGMKLKANMISAFMMGLGGTFYAQFMNTLDPNRVLGYDMSVQVLLFSIIGGAGTLTGPVLAAVLLVPFQDIIRGWVGSSVQGLAPLLYGVVLCVVVYFMPKGLWPTIVKLCKNWIASKKENAGKEQVTGS